MHVPFSIVLCPSCGSTFETETLAPPDNGVPTTCSQTNQGSQRVAMYAPAAVLHTWKELATYLAIGVRTAQRLEHDFGLPVHRPKGMDRSAVLAFPSELDNWLHGTPVRAVEPERRVSNVEPNFPNRQVAHSRQQTTALLWHKVRVQLDRQMQAAGILVSTVQATMKKANTASIPAK